MDLILSGGGGTTLVVSGPATRQPTLGGSVSLDMPAGNARIRPGSGIRWVGPSSSTILELTTAVMSPLERWGGLRAAVVAIGRPQPDPYRALRPVRAVGVPSMGLAVKTHLPYTPSAQVLAAGVRVL